MARVRSNSEEELIVLNNKEPQLISGVDFVENSKETLKFRKIPWVEFVPGWTLIFLGLCYMIY